MSDRFEVNDLGAEQYAGVDLPESGRLPYRVWLIADFAGSDFATLDGRLASDIVEVSASTFDEVMADSRLRVGMRVADPFDPKEQPAAIELVVDVLKSIEPAALIERIPAARELAGLRERVASRLMGKIGPADLEAALEEARHRSPKFGWLSTSVSRLHSAPKPESTTGAAAEDLLAQIDLGGSGAPSPASGAGANAVGAGAMIGALASTGTISAAESTALHGLLAEIDRRLDGWIAAVSQSPAMRAVESAWRGLALLISNAESRAGLRVSILHAPRAELVQRIRERTIDPVFEHGAESPDLLILDYAFSNSAADMESLDEIAQLAASLPVVAIAGAAPAFLGVKFPWMVPTLPPLGTLFDQWQYAKWRSLRSQFYARSLAMVFGQGLLREPRAREADRPLEYQFDNHIAGAHELVWVNGAVITGAAICRSVAETGWPTRVAGVAGGKVGGFSASEDGRDGQKAIGPSDTGMQLPKIQDLAIVGLNAVVGAKGDSDVVFWNGLTIAKPARMDPGGILEVSLPYQLFATRLAGLLLRAQDDLAGVPSASLACGIQQKIIQWIGLDPASAQAAVTVQARAPADDPAGLEFAATVVPPAHLLPGAVPIVLGYRIR